MTSEELHRFITQALSIAPDRLLDAHLAAWCKGCPPPPQEDPHRFLRDVVDMAVFIGGASQGVMIMMEDFAEFDRESEAEAEARRATLERRCKDLQYGLSPCEKTKETAE